MNDTADRLKDALMESHDRGYSAGAVNALKALSKSFHSVSDSGAFTGEMKRGYDVGMRTIDGVLEHIEQDAEKKGL